MILFNNQHIFSVTILTKLLIRNNSHKFNSVQYSTWTCPWMWFKQNDRKNSLFLTSLTISIFIVFHFYCCCFDEPETFQINGTHKSNHNNELIMMKNDAYTKFNTNHLHIPCQPNLFNRNLIEITWNTISIRSKILSGNRMKTDIFFPEF